MTGLVLWVFGSGKGSMVRGYSERASMQRILASLMMVGFVCTAVGAANAQVPNACGDRGMIVERLDTGYSEKPVAMGLSVNGSIVEIFASQNGSFTIIATQPTGESCILVTGESWEGLMAGKTDLPI